MNDLTNKEKQFEEAGKHRIVIDGIPYTVMVFFRTDTKETGISKIMQLAKSDIVANPIPTRQKKSIIFRDLSPRIDNTFGDITQMKYSINKFMLVNSRKNLEKLDENNNLRYNDAEEKDLGDGGICYAVPVLSKEL